MLREYIVFSLVFLAQIFVMSHYFPKRVLARTRNLIDSYPPESYPKMYPLSVEYYRVGLWAFAMISNALLGLGLLVLVAVLFWVDHSNFADDGHISEAWPAAYGILQFVPFIMLEVFSFKHFKLMRAANLSKTRKAELQPRRLGDVIPAKLFSLALALALGTVLLDFYLHDFNFSWNHDSSQRALSLALGNLCMAGIGAWNIYGRKLDPYQSSADRQRQTRVQITSLVLVSIVVSLFFMTQVADSLWDIDDLDAPLMSLYFIVIASFSIGFSLKQVNIDDLDLEVYRGDAATTK